MNTPPSLDAFAVNLEIIGRVQTAVPDADIARARRELVSRIVIAPRFAEALTGIEAYSQIIVLFWLDRARPSEGWLTHPARPPLLALSVPCARGEEAYSIAIALIDRGLSAARTNRR